MRKLYVADPEQSFAKQEREALKLGVPEIARGCPARYTGLVKTLPAIILEDGERVVAVLNKAHFSIEAIALVEEKVMRPEERP